VLEMVLDGRPQLIERLEFLIQFKGLNHLSSSEMYDLLIKIMHDHIKHFSEWFLFGEFFGSFEKS